jgi:cytidyltransferase-like protein
VLFPGSFNPLHDGHRILADRAAQHFGQPVTFELSIANVDKPTLTPAEVQRRVAQFHAPLCITAAPLFVRKAALFPGTVFVLGADTALRLLDATYYPTGEQGLWDALMFIQAQGCRFFVGGRRGADGTFIEVAHLALPRVFRPLFTGLREAQFRVDLSSTELRQG